MLSKKSVGMLAVLAFAAGSRAPFAQQLSAKGAAGQTARLPRASPATPDDGHGKLGRKKASRKPK